MFGRNYCTQVVAWSTFTVPLVDNWCAGVAAVFRIDEFSKGAGVAEVKVHHGEIGRLTSKPAPH